LILNVFRATPALFLRGPNRVEIILAAPDPCIPEPCVSFFNFSYAHNSDLGDAWEYMDYPCYPEKSSGQAYRMGINFMIYAMTH